MERRSRGARASLCLSPHFHIATGGQATRAHRHHTKPHEHTEKHRTTRRQILHNPAQHETRRDQRASKFSGRQPLIHARAVSLAIRESHMGPTTCSARHCSRRRHDLESLSTLAISRHRPVLLPPSAPHGSEKTEVRGSSLSGACARHGAAFGLSSSSSSSWPSWFSSRGSPPAQTRLPRARRRPHPRPSPRRSSAPQRPPQTFWLRVG